MLEQVSGTVGGTEGIVVSATALAEGAASLLTELSGVFEASNPPARPSIPVADGATSLLNELTGALEGSDPPERTAPSEVQAQVAHQDETADDSPPRIELPGLEASGDEPSISEGSLPAPGGTDGSIVWKAERKSFFRFRR
jgi:hypothetical protein